MEEILRAADDLGADLIVMGTHGRTGLGRLLMGSVAEAVLRQAVCPVLLARKAADKDRVEAPHAGAAPVSGRVVNVVDLMKLQPATEHPHGLDDHDFDDLFTRDKSGALMTLRLQLVGSPTQSVTQFPGGFADPDLRDPRPAATSITVTPSYVSQPGHDLNTLVQQYGTVHLLAGIYPMSQPLDLVNPVSLVADPGTTLLFSQPAASPVWSYAVEIHASHTTIAGTAAGALAIRFATPVRWAPDFQKEPGVIGSAYGPGYGPDPKVDINLINLDLAYSPGPADLNRYGVSDVELIRMNDEDSGVIADDTLRGGLVEVFGGPWRISGNDYQGAFPGTAVSQVFAVRGGNVVVIEDNHAHSVGASGITYGFVLFTGGSVDTTVNDNTVDDGIGRDASVTPGGSYNFPELILTEEYAPHYEGEAFVSPVSRRILQVPALRGTPCVAGDVVAILSGPDAGRWFRITQAIDDHNYILGGDLPGGSYAVSINQGFVNDLYEGNRIDTRSLAESSSVAFDLNGPHFGTTIRGNTVIGAQPFAIAASPTTDSTGSGATYPVPWGWTHTPIFGLSITGNTFQDPVFWTPGGGEAVVGGSIAVDHGPGIGENAGRLYLEGDITDNRFVYTDTVLKGTTGDITAILVGEAGSIDPRELVINDDQGNTVQAPASFAAEGRSATIQVVAGVVAGQTGPATIDLAPAKTPLSRV